MKSAWIVIGICLLVVAGVLSLVPYNIPPLTPKLPEPPLKTLAARHNIQLGNFAMPSRLDEQPYRDILTSQFDFALIDNQPNWHFVDADLRPSPTSYNFSRIDEVLRFTRQHDMPVQMHHFLWGEEKWLPNWLLHGNYDKVALHELMRDHITTVGKRYSGQVQEWTVVNEAFSREQHIYGLRDWWADHTGDTDYISEAFVWARQADPHAKLILNDFGNESQNAISDAMYSYINSVALPKGIPIDGIGMQMHIDGTKPPNKEAVIANMKRFGDLGLEVYVTEFDVNMNDVAAIGAVKDKLAGDIYYDMMRACIESDFCHSFAFLGITDKESWYNYMDITDARPLMFDRRYQPKPAFDMTRKALSEP